jgi:hypothetical protein
MILDTHRNAAIRGGPRPDQAAGSFSMMRKARAQVWKRLVASPSLPQGHTIWTGADTRVCRPNPETRKDRAVEATRAERREIATGPLLKLTSSWN